MKYYRNSNVFEKIDTEEKAYWLGFLYADGYVDPERGEIILGLADKDKEHIDKFRLFLETNAPYKDKINNQKKPYRFFRLYDKKLCEDLEKQGLYRKKSLTLEPKMIIPNEFLIAWSRGLFDGDGSIFPQKNSKNSIRYRIDLMGTEPVLNYVMNLWQISKKLDRNRTVPKIVVAGKREVNRILHLLYDDATIYLDRKYNLSRTAIESNL
jgi:hypothetical protein